MPLYEYACQSCGHRFEVIQRLSEDPLTTCVKCAGAVERLISSPAIQFKGSGWYITDYARKGSAAPGKSDKAEKDSGGESKTEKLGSEGKTETSTATSTSSGKDG